MFKNRAKNSTKEKFLRKLSISERGWLVCDNICPPFHNQAVFEGAGEPDIKLWKEAISIASEANPGSRLVLRGMLNACRWVDSKAAPRLREVDGSNWSGMGSQGAPFLKERLSVNEGPSCEVLVMHGDPVRIAFRSHHAVMDGRGTLIWAEDIFRALNEEKPLGANSNITDIELIKSFNMDYRKPFPRDNIAPTGKADGISFEVRWARKKIVGKYPKLMPQVAVLMAKEARSYTDGNVWIAAPVDLRSRKFGLRSTANLCNAIYVEVPRDASYEKIAEDISEQIENKCDLMLDKGDSLFRFVPLWILEKTVSKILLKRHRLGQYGFSGLISNIGLVNLTEFTGGGFKPESVFLIPPGGANPAFMVLTGSDGGIEMTYSIPEVLATNNRLEDSLERIAAGLITRDKKLESES